MKAAVVQAARTNPVYADFPDPIAQGEHEIIAVHASALTHLAKARASGAHYSAGGKFPGVAGTDGVGRTADGRRLYFAQPLAPNGAMSERTLIHPKYTVSVPDEIDDVTAAAIANPGMSAWAALLERAHLVKGETVLVNGATGTAGRIAVQLARHLGAARVIATGRNLAELEEVKSLGADLTVPLGPELEAAMIEQCARGIDVVVDYLWGDSARTLITAIAKGSADGHPVRFVHVGGASGQQSLDLPGVALRSSGIALMGSGMRSVSMAALLNAVKNIFDLSAQLRIDTRTAPLSQVGELWDAPGKPRLVFEIA